MQSEAEVSQKQAETLHFLEGEGACSDAGRGFSIVDESLETLEEVLVIGEPEDEDIELKK